MRGIGEGGISQLNKPPRTPPARSVKVAHAAILIDVTTKSLKRESPSRGRHSQALGVYILNPAHVATGRLHLSQVPHVAWKYFWDGSKKSVSVEVARALGEQRHVATARSTGPGNSRLLRALKRATRRAKEARYSVRLLSAPPLVHSAIWLKSPRHRGDKVIAIESIVKEIQPLKEYGMSEFLELLRPEAAKLIEYSKNMFAENRT